MAKNCGKISSMNRHHIRENIVFAVYRHRLLNNSLFEEKEELLQTVSHPLLSEAELREDFSSFKETEDVTSNEIKEECVDEPLPSETVTRKLEEDLDYISSIFDLIIENETSYIDELSGHLSQWSFDRLGYVDQGILLTACAERQFGLDKAIVVNEAVNLAKRYCDEDSYRYINGVLDTL